VGANLDFITSNVVGHVAGYDNAPIAAALAGSVEEDCDVRTYGGTTPNWVRFWSHTAKSPQGSFWWQFQLLGDVLPDNIDPPPADVTSPWWQFDEEA
jgi:hypothetical protein